jgi:glycosyltransferase involved in cell wall biosynthesis
MTEHMTANRNVELLLASTHFFPTHGGAQLRFLRYIPGLRKRGIFTRVLAGTAKSKKRPDTQYDASAENDESLLSKEFLDQIDLQHVSLPQSAGWPRSMVFSRAILRACESEANRPQLVQVVSSLQPRSMIWLKRLRRLGIPLVYAYTLSAQAPKNPLKRIVRKYALAYLYNRLDCIIVNSRTIIQELHQFEGNTRIEFIPNGIDLQRFRPPASEDERINTRARLGIDYRQTVLISVGAVHPRKGTDLILEAWSGIAKRFPDVHLYLLGLRKDISYPALDRFRDKLQALIGQSGAPERVHFEGMVRNVDEYLRAADIFMFPSEREGMPNGVLEAMASGLPVALTPFAGFSDDLGSANREFMLVERNSAALTQALETLIEDKNLRINLGQNARLRAESRFDLEQSLDHYSALYHELVGSIDSSGKP